MSPLDALLQKVQPARGPLNMLGADCFKLMLEQELLKELRGETAMQFIASARQPLEHGIVWSYEFDNQNVRCQFGGKGEYVVERYTLRHQHVMDHGKHQDGIKFSAGAIE